MKIEAINKQKEILKTAATFGEIGISRIESFALAAIINGNSTAREIEKATDMRQPEVSRACRLLLQDRGWIKEGEKIARRTKGRPEQTYELSMAKDKLIEKIRTEREKEINAELEKLKKFK